MKEIFVIEHLEPELYEWCIIEYKHISELVGSKNLWFTNIPPKDTGKLSKFGKVFIESVKDMKLDSVCVLDPESKLVLEPKDKFKYMVFGGILGDNPPRKRTGPELTKFMKNIETRNIGPAQFSTDNAVYVTKKILDGTPLNKIPFKDEIEIEINSVESTILPYRYPLINGKPNISPELIEYLKKNS